MHTCQWHPDGKHVCGQPASKCARLTGKYPIKYEDEDGNTTEIGPETKIIWLCDQHYTDHWTESNSLIDVEF